MGNGSRGIKSNSSEFNPALAVEYFKSVFDKEIGLMIEAPKVKPDWLWVYIDNWLAFHAIKNYASESEQEFLSKLSRGLDRHIPEQRHNRIEVLMNIPIDDMWLKPLKIVIKEYGDKKVWSEACYGDPIQGWDQYADLCFLAAINYANKGNWVKSHWYFWKGRLMWDGKGFNDLIAKKVGYYATYKLALYLLASQRVRTIFKIDSETKEIIGKMQGTSGGIYTDYTKDFNIPHPEVDTNTETTAFCLLALS